MESGETLEAALIRELEEELGVLAAVIRPMAQVPAPGGALHRFFLVRWISGEFGTGPDHDYDRPTWLSPADAVAGNLRPPSVARLIADVCGGASWPQHELELQED